MRYGYYRYETGLMLVVVVVLIVLVQVIQMTEILLSTGLIKDNKIKEEKY